MNGMRAFAAAAFLVAGLAAVRPADAAPLDSSTVCAGLYQTQVLKLAIYENKSVPFLWIRRAANKKEIKLDLQIYWPTGTKLYTGFHCRIQSDGSIVTDEGKSSKSNH